MRIVFMGTPDFAVPSLAALLNNGHQVAAVYTQPDRPSGRHLRLTSSPVKKFAGSHQLPVRQPEDFKSRETIGELRAFQPDILAVAAYGLILPRDVLAIPRIAPLNVHASLLPRWRGAAPIQWAIMSGDRETGITIMRMARRLDSGDILCQTRLEIGPSDTAGHLHNRLMELGAITLCQALTGLETGQAVFTPQDESLATCAPRLDRELAWLDWGESAAACERRIRGLNPWPGAATRLRQETCKIWEARLAGPAPAGTAGRLTVERDRLLVLCGDGQWLELVSLQLPGRKAQTARDFMNGLHLREGESLG